ncbi:MAG: DUF86 domain-containing protein [Thermodesulfobacteriota bacterium]
MFDHNLVLSIVTQVDGALQKIADRAARFKSADEFTASSSGMEALDSICMLFMAVGEALKHIDKITEGRLFARCPEVDWKGAMGFRDVIAHHYFDIDAEQVFWICAHELKPLLAAIRKIRDELQ